MNKLKLGLEQRVFILYIILTFLLVLILAFSEWQLAKFGIWQFENKRINEIIQEYRSTRNRLINESQNFVNLLSTSRNLVTAVTKKDSMEVRRLIEFYSNNQQPEFLAIYSSDYELIYGENWELIESYLPVIFDHAENRPYKTFYTTFGSKIYRLTYSVIYHDLPENEISGIVIRAEFQDSKLYQIYDSGYTYLFPYPLEMSGSLQPPSFIHNRFEKLKSEISRLTADQKTNSISRLGPDLAVGIEIEYDLTVSPKAVFLLVYSRNVNVFAQQSV
ncbi:MAG: hypothetical protein JW996_00885, partial [Candidatus Cloacimonetes bacterium]|nr:hypothetical protein [Candidatus Cloacimonadota bacterium]